MANSLKIDGIRELLSFRRRVERQYALPGEIWDHRISKEDHDELVNLVDSLITKVENLTEDSPDLKRRY